MKNFKLLKKLSEISGTSGFENEIRRFILKKVNNFSENISVDNIGNITVFKEGRSRKKLMLAAHIDEIGFIVTHIDDNGFLRFTTIGGFDPKTVVAQRVVVHGKKDLLGVVGSKPVHLMSMAERGKKVEIKDFFIDLGMNKKNVEKYVEIGTPVTRKSELVEMGDFVNGKSLDNRISVFVLLEVMRKLKNIELPFDTYFVFTVQEEVGLRGAQVAALQIQPDFALAIDTTIAYDTPGALIHESVTKSGNGTAIKIMDAGVIADYRMVKFLKKTANNHNIKFQSELLKGGGTDTARLQQMVKGGSIAGAVSLPTRYIHSTVESVNKSDIKTSINLVKSSILEIHTFNWNF